ncbi:hypothetical protein BGX30_002405, partial [Mortierella sp. GBA39]
SPRCFEIETRLAQELDMPIFHDDQHGTAVVVIAGLLNALKVVNKRMENIRVVVNGIGAAGLAAARAIASVVSGGELNELYIIPSIFNEQVVIEIRKAVVQAAILTGVARRIPKDFR